MEQLIKNHEEMEWEAAKGYPAGTRIKVLLERGDANTFLLQLHAGFEMTAHSHVCNEQHLVINGAYDSDGETYTKGAFRYIPKHTEHGPFRSADGATILVIWDTMDIK